MKTNAILPMLIFSCLMFTEAFARSFGAAVKNNEISYFVDVSPDGPRRMRLKIKNLLKRENRVIVESGRFFHTADGTQPMVVARPVAILLDPAEEREVYVDPYCGFSRWSGPSVGQTFNRTTMGPANLVEMLTYMNQQKIVSRSLYQNVIWFYTNNHQIASVHGYDADSVAVRAVRSQICKREKIKEPWYTITYHPAASGDPLEFSGNPDKINGTFNLNLDTKSNLKVELHTAAGELKEVLHVYLNVAEGASALPLEIDRGDYEMGKYFVKVINDKGETLAAKEIDVS
jgi:hypothetical protein